MSETQMQGAVVAVITELQGGFVQSWTDNMMTVANAADFSREGGQFTPDGGVTVYDFNSVLDGATDEDPDVVMTTQLAPDDWPTDDEVRVDIWPYAVDVIAEVATDPDDTLPVVVPHALRAVLNDGIRDVDDQERVLIEQRGGQWVVVDVIGRGAAIDMETVVNLVPTLDYHQEEIEAANTAMAQEQATRQAALDQLNKDLATEAQTRSDALAAEQKARSDADTALSQVISTRPVVTSSATAPTSPNKGDTWFQLDGSGNTTGVQTWNGTSWVPQALTGSSLLAGSITTANLAAGAITGDKIAASAITADKLQAGAITSDKIATGAITADKVAADAITADKIKAGAVGADEIAANAITGDKVSANAITGDKILAKSITTDKLMVGSGGQLMPDPTFSSYAVWGNDNFVDFLIAGGYKSATCVRFAATSTGDTYVGQSISLKKGDVAAFSVWVKMDTDSPHALTISLVPGNSGTIAPPDVTSTTDGPYKAGQWQKYVVQYKAATQDITSSFRIYPRDTATSPVTISDVSLTINGSTTNILQDPGFADSSKWTIGGSSNDSRLMTAGGHTTNTSLRLMTKSMYSPALRYVSQASLIPVTPGSALKFSVWVKPDYAASIGDFQADIYTPDPGDSTKWISLAHISNQASIASGTWSQLIGNLTVPDGVLFMRPGVTFMPRAQNLGATFSDFTIQPMADGSLIVDGAINGKTISGADIYSPSQTATPRVHLGGSKFEVIRSNSDGHEFTSMSLGGTDADSLLLLDGNGNNLAGFDPTGAAVGQSLAINGDAQVAGNIDAQSVSLNGTDLQGTLNALPGGLIARQLFGSTASGNGVKFGNNWLGYYELFYSAPGHTIRVTYDGLVWFSAAGTYIFHLVSTSHPDPTVVPASPKADGSTGSVLAQVTMQAPNAGYYGLHISGWTTPYVGSQRVLLAAIANSSSTYGQVYSSDAAQAWMYAEDMGIYSGNGDGGYNRGGGTVYSGSSAPTETAPVATKKSYTSIWNAAWVKSWRDGAVVTDFLQQGYYSPAQRYSMIGFTGNNAVSGETGKSITAALSGATISKVEVYLVNKSFYSPSGGEAIIGHHGNNSAPSSPQISGGGAFATGTWASGAGQWVTLPSSWYSSFASGAYDGITLGEGAGSNSLYYGKFSNALGDNRLRITYTR